MTQRNSVEPRRATILLRWARKLHLWSGIALSLFIVVIALTGVFLLHAKDLPRLGAVGVPARVLPTHYRGEPEKLRDLVVLDETGQRRMLIGTTRFYLTSDGGRTIHRIGSGNSLVGPRAATSTSRALWLGHQAGLSRCDLDGSSCVDVALPAAAGADPEVSSILAQTAGIGGAERLVVAIHRVGVFSSDNDGADWNDLSQGLVRLAATPISRLHVHALHQSGDVLLVGTSRGLYGLDATGEWISTGLKDGYVVDLGPGTDPGEVLASLKSRSLLWLMRSTDYGVTFSAVATQASHLLRGLAEGPREVEARLARHFAGSASTIAIADSGVFQITATGNVEPLEHPMDLATLPEIQTVPLKKVLIDLHTGEFFAGKLWVIYDLVAIALMFFVLTGLYLWMGPKVMKRRSAQARAVALGRPASAIPMHATASSRLQTEE